jgi:hypothetical protein
MKTNSKVVRVGAASLWGMALVWLGLSCKDDEPCDPGFVERGASACYPVATGGSGGSPGGGGSAGDPGTAGTTDVGEQPDAGDSGAAAPPPVEAEVGQTCTDTANHSDCGGAAPICAPLPSGTVCTQILCLDGETNAGACPADAPCIPTGATTPSICFPM